MSIQFHYAELKDNLQEDFQYLRRILDEDDNMDDELICLHQWRNNIKAYMPEIHKCGYSPE